MRRVFLLCAFPALSPVLLASDEKAPPSTSPADSSIAPATPALFSWGDIDRDGRLDLAAVSSEGELQLLSNAGEGRFEDVTEELGLSGVATAAFALWADYDSDGRLDLFVGARTGKSRLFRNEGSTFIDMSAGSGLQVEGTVQSAHWLDHDGDGKLDLHVVTVEKNELFRSLEGGFFEVTELPLASAEITPRLRGSLMSTNGESMDGLDANGLGTPSAPESSSEKNGVRAGDSISGVVSIDGVDVSGGRVAVGPSVGGATQLFPFPLACASSIKDQANPGSCLQASSTPTLGMLYPISADLFVAVSGNVGIGTTTPAARLDVAGTARMSDTLTLAPAGDHALDVSTGSIYKGGVLFAHTKGGSFNNAFGRQALASVTSGFENMASGERALFSNTTGYRNTASGYRALGSNTTGFSNTALGAQALTSNTTGYANTASGVRALLSNTTGSYNTASGYSALRFNTTGNNNTASGFQALSFNTTGSSNAATGWRALYSNTTGARNMASGGRALLSNTTGSDNVASGYRALASNTIGQANTACGSDALVSNTTGSFNTASGLGALLFNKTGNGNTANGLKALYSNTTGNYNTASGYSALSANKTGSRNTATGIGALFYNTTGTHNAAHGAGALRSNTSANGNTASGAYALGFNTTGILNTACGYRALFSNSTGARNIALGQYAGFLTTGNDNIAIGNSGVLGEGNTIRIGTAETHTRAFIAGIRGVTTGNANAIPVLIDSAGQLGTVSSSRRFKKDIADMGELSERLLELRPVVFRYKEEQKVESGDVPLEYGLIAEEVAEVFPDLVVYDEEGEPFTVRYHLLSSMLLNELQKLNERFEGQNETLRALEARLAAVESRASPASLPAAIPAESFR